MQPRKCPQCGKTIEDDGNYSFDEQLNLICGGCGKIAFPTSWQTNNEIDNAVREKKGGWANSKQTDSQSTFPRQTSGVGVHGQTGGVIGLHNRRPQVQGNPPPNQFADRFGHFPHDDVDDYQELPFYA
jgi:hypothetical protein